MLSRSRQPPSPSPAESVGAVLNALGPRRASARDRGFRIALAVMLAARHLDRPVDLLRALEMALAQGLPVPPAALDPDNALHLRALLLELDAAGTSEARLVLALGDLLDGREPRLRERFLAALGGALKSGSATRATTARHRC